VAVKGMPGGVARNLVYGTMVESKVTTVAVVDDQPVTRLGLEQVLSSHSGINVVGSADRLGQLASLTEAPDVVLLALSASHDGDIGGLLRTYDAGGAVLVILTDVRDLPGVLSEAIRLRVSGAVSRDARVDEVLFAVDAAARGGWYVSAELIARFRAQRAAYSVVRPNLTPREVETASLLAKGLTHRQIARHMGLTEETVNTYVKRMRVKFSAGNKAALTRTLIEHGYVTVNAPHGARQPVRIADAE